MTWSSTETGVATVGSDGLVSAVGAGTAVIVATHGAVADSTTIVVEIPAAIEIAPAADTLFALGDTLRLRATVTDADGDTIDGATVVWSSLDAALARVDAYGRVTARDTGEARIVASIGALADTALLSVAPDTTTSPAAPRGAAAEAFPAELDATAAAASTERGLVASRADRRRRARNG